MHPFQSAWDSWVPPESGPVCLGSDLPVIEQLTERGLTCQHTTWPEHCDADDFESPGDHRLHLGLVPKPSIGDPSTARVVVLMLNPGLGPQDYFGELTQPAFRQAMLSNLKPSLARYQGFVFLDPHFGWHGGFTYWNGKFRQLISHIAKSRSICQREARALLRLKISGMELLPYHSDSFGIPPRYVRKLSSVRLARDFVHDVLAPRAANGDCLLLITRKAKDWGLSERKGVVVYGRGEARGAHLTPQSRGGSRLLEYLA